MESLLFPDPKVTLTVVVPAFNESAVIYKVLRAFPKKISSVSKINLVVIDDGSRDETGNEAKKAGAIVIRHPINRGVGAATKTGIEWAKKNKSDVLVTFDADGQHNPKDVPKIVDLITKGKYDLAIGSRFKKNQKVPLDRWILNWSANLVTLLLFGAFSTDTQSGLRAFSKKAITKINLRQDRMEVSSEIILEAKRNNLRIKEIPTSAIYTKYSRIKGQKNTNAFPILLRFLVRFLR